MAISICVYLSSVVVVKGVLQYVGCFGEGRGLSWANVEDPQHSPKHRQGRPVVRVSGK